MATAAEDTRQIGGTAAEQAPGIGAPRGEVHSDASAAPMGRRATPAPAEPRRAAEDRLLTERELFALMDAELYEGPERYLAIEQDREDDEARWAWE